MIHLHYFASSYYHSCIPGRPRSAVKRVGDAAWKAMRSEDERIRVPGIDASLEKEVLLYNMASTY